MNLVYLVYQIKMMIQKSLEKRIKVVLVADINQEKSHVADLENINISTRRSIRNIIVINTSTGINHHQEKKSKDINFKI